MYTKFFNFKEKPFNVTPDPRFLYLSPSHQEALATMLYGIQERRGFVSVIGEIGTGKTTLLHTLFAELNNEVQTAFIFNTRVNFKQLLQNILIELELTPSSENKALLLNQLNDFLIKKLASNEIVALIIDEAQNLSSPVLEELRMLSNLETTKDKLLQIILVGQPELDSKLRSHNLRQLKQRIGINCYLTPLNNEDQRKYIEHRLNIAGSSTYQIFSRKALELICKRAQGIPRVINILCDNALLTAYSRGINKIDDNLLQEVISDYEIKDSPHEEIKDISSTARNQIKTKKPRKLFLITALYLLVILQFLFIGFYFYINNPNFFRQLTNIPHSNPTKLSPPNNRSSENYNPLELTEKQNEPSSFYKEDFGPLQFLESAEHTPIEQVLSMTTAPEQTEQFAEDDSNPVISSSEKQSTPVFAKEGDIVSALALVHYGTINDTIIDIVKRANPGIIDLDNIEIGQEINFPTFDIDNFIIKNENGTFSIHISTFSSYDNALRLHKKLEANNYDSSISPIQVVGKINWYRVSLGNFSSHSQAIEYARNTDLEGTFYVFQD